MLANRLVMKDEKSQEIAPRAESSQDVLTANDAIKAEKADLEKQIPQDIDAYNKGKKKDAEKPYERMLPSLDKKNPDPNKVIQAIDALLNKEFDYEGKNGKSTSQTLNQIKDGFESSSAKSAKKALLEIKDSLQALAAVNESAHEQHSNVELAISSQALEQAIDYSLARAAKSDLWKGKQEYNSANTYFDRATTHPLLSGGSDRFKRLWTAPDGTLDISKRNESRNLFFSILAEQTNGFEDGSFALGEKFKNNFADNRLNFPYIYNEWLTYNGVDEAQIEALTKQVDSLKDQVIPVQKLLSPHLNKAPIGSEYDELMGMTDEPTLPYWNKKKDLLSTIINRLNEAASKTDEAQQKIWEKDAELLEQHVRLADRQISLISVKSKQTEASERFTRAELSKNPPMVMEFAMRQFEQAIQIVDRPLNAEQGDYYDPLVRRALIAQAYAAGISEVTYENMSLASEGEIKNLPPQDRMLYTVISSKEFSKESVGRHLTEDQRNQLVLLHYGSDAARRKEVLAQTTIPFFDEFYPLKVAKEKLEAKYRPELTDPYKNYHANEVLAELNTAKADPKKDASNTAKISLLEDIYALKLQEEKLAAKYPASLMGTYENLPSKKVLELKQSAEADLKKYDDFIVRSQEALEDPKKAAIFIQELKAGTYKNNALSSLDTVIVDPEEFETTKKQLEATEINHNAIELDNRDKMQFLENMGIRINGIYPSYLEAIQKDPNLQVENWNDLYKNKSGDLLKLIQSLIKKNSDPRNKGSEHFLRVFASVLSSSPAEIANDKAKTQAFTIFNLLKAEIEGRKEIAARTDLSVDKVNEKMRGFSIADKASKVIENVMDMFSGSWPEKIAGFILAAGALKLAKRAWNPKEGDKVGQGLRALFVAGAMETYLEKQGRGLTEMLGFNTLSETLEGTYKGVLLEDGQAFMNEKGINEKEHGSALVALDNVPFEKAMAWYEASNQGLGNEGLGADGLFGGLGINTRNIEKAYGKGLSTVMDNRKSSERVKRAKQVLFFTIQHAFGYMGRKDGQSREDSAKALKERYVTLVNNPGQKPEHSERMPESFCEDYANHKSEITWARVISSEIGVQAVQDSIGKNNASKLATMLGESADAVSEWVRQKAVGGSEVVVADFFEKFGRSAGELKKRLGETVDATKYKLIFLKDQVKFKYKENEMELKRLASGHIELIKTGLGIPFRVMVAADKFTIPWLDKRLRQVTEILQINESKTFSKGDLAPTDLAGAEGIKRFGTMFQTQFEQAFAAKKAGDKKMHFEDTTENVGYYITEVTPANVRLKHGDPGYMKNSMMIQKSWEDAMEHFTDISPGLAPNGNKDNFDKYLYAVHTFHSGNPEKTYMFFRMPLAGSPELQMKEEGRWADSNLPDKNQPPFKLDDQAGIVDNLKRAFVYDSTPTRTFSNATAAILFQGIHAGSALGSGFAHLANLAVDFSRMDKKNKDMFHNTINMVRPDESTKQHLDELTTAAKSPGLSTSEFYENPENGRIFSLLLDFAYDQRQALCTSIFESDAFKTKGKGKTAVEGYAAGSDYRAKPAGFSYAKLNAYYENTWKAHNGNIKKFDDVIGKLIQTEG